MPSGTQLVTFSIAAAIAMLASAKAWGRGRSTPDLPTGPDCDPTPYTWSEAAIKASIDAEINAGRTDPTTIAVNVATEHFGKYPTSGADVMFPPIGQPQAGVQCVWDRVLNLVEQRLIDQPSGPVIFVNHGALDPGYPWPEPTVHRGGDGAHAPTPGMFYIVGHPDASPTINNLGHILRNVLGAAIVMANTNGQGPNSLDPTLAGSQDQPYKGLRMEIIKYLLNPWNWKLYAQTNANLAGGADPGKGGVGCNDNNIRPAATTPITYMMCGGHGLNWCPRHANNIQRLAQGLRPIRTTQENGKEIAPGGSSQMQLWIPAFDLNALRAAVPTIRTIANPHPGWANTIVPPPAVWNRGIEGPVIGGGCPGIPTV